MLSAPGRLWCARRSVVLHLLRRSSCVLIASGSDVSATGGGGNASSTIDSGGAADGDASPSFRLIGGGGARKGKSKRRELDGRRTTEKRAVRKPKYDAEDSALSTTPTAGVTEGIGVALSSLVSSSSSMDTADDYMLQLHRRLSAKALEQHHSQAGETIASGAANVAREKIERRRKKWALSETEFDTGVTERLFPEIRRLSALHELHYGDATMREVDAATYFASTHKDRTSAVAATSGEVAETTITNADFLAFDECEVAQKSSTRERATTPTPTIGAVGAVSLKTPGLSGDGSKLVKEESEQLPGCPSAGNEKEVAHGVHTPWFVPAGGVVRLEPLPPSDVLCLMRTVLRLRQQTPRHLPLAVRQRMKMTEALTDATIHDKNILAKCLSFEDVLVYLDTAPAPILGFTENLPSGKSPAFVFVLYTENVSLQNAIGHMAALFGVPQRAFHTCTAVSKMSCGSVLCAVGPNNLHREHLLLLNTMRHPGFVLRVGSIRAVDDEERCADLFGELSRWQPLHEVELLLRRVSCRSSQELEHRLRAVQEVGAVFFCANREASLARAATDVLHGFYKSALLNALHRRNAPLAMRQFLARPHPIAAARARRVSTDATVRQVLKGYILVGGDWAQAVGRTPYVWRRRWLNALRCTVWNTMASRRLRSGGRHVLPGDVVLRPEYRADAQRRMLTTVKAQHVMLVRDAAEAAECSVEDIFIPFLRGVYPQELFAPDATNHPIMTRANMLALLRELHAPQLLLGMSDVCRQLLDIRGDTSPLLFRRFILRPVEMRFTILEDKAPIKSVHFDAGRILSNDRLHMQQPTLLGTSDHNKTAAAAAAAAAGEGSATESSPHALPSPSSLLSQEVVLQRTTIGDRLSSGVLADEFFALPGREEYIALGHVERHLHGNLVRAAPRSPDEALKTIDRLFTVHVHAVVRNGAAALGHLLREYFILGGVEREDDSALQHKIHRMRRELDSETPRLTAPTFCQACYCRDHDSLDACAEYQLKRSRQLHHRQREEALQQLAAADTPVLPLPAAGENSTTGGVVAMNDLGGLDDTSLELVLRLRRRSEKQRWGVHLTSTLRLSAIDDVSLVAEGHIRCGGSAVRNPVALKSFLLELLQQEKGCVAVADNEEKEIDGDATSQRVALRQFITTAMGGDENFLRSVDRGEITSMCSGGDGLLLPRLCDVFVDAPSQPAIPASVAELSDSRALLRRCLWVLTGVNDTAVAGRRQVAAVFVRLGKEREVRLRFTAIVRGCGVDVHNARDGGIDAGSQPDVAARFPVSLELSLTRRSGAKGGWGIKLDSDSLALLNLSELLLAQGPSGLIASVDPPFPLVAGDARSLDGRYVVRRVDGHVVKCQHDVVECLQGRVAPMKKGTDVLCLQLVLSQGQNEQHCSTTTLNETTMPAVKSSPTAEADVEGTGATRDVAATEKTPVDASSALELPPCSPQCTQLTAAQQKRSLLTIVVSRNAAAPPGRWGIRVRRGSVRLLRLQHNHLYSFQVYAAKQQQAVRVADTLRFNSVRRRVRGGNDDDDKNTEREAVTPSIPTEVAFFSHFVYVIVGVNHRRIGGCEELRVSLADAARSTDEAVVLQVQQYRLAQIAVTIERHEVDGGAALEPVGLRISRDMVIESIAAGGPMARAILAATHDGCSLRRLIEGAPPVSDALSEDVKKGVATTTVTEMTNSSANSLHPPKWQFDLDEDTQKQMANPPAATAEDLTKNNMNSSSSSSSSSTGTASNCGPCAHWNMVDGVALTAAQGELEEAQFVWRVTYAVHAGPLRTPQDAVRALGGDVREETLFLQQCVMDD
ncbi:hypothetical protein DQ04_00041170 [Trypanosoma grayi]|uniref:hypothetical protein n=1 Tax=Trypanosoma grayi TaxID=71804 RepID=UPI0004F4AF23|nr:hypothetical protein DQ04_00041170 [Trypanosoma grayi]KEG15553.1 hypothetical protein DQ04_00041170 [Trypanosoma grayi]